MRRRQRVSVVAAERLASSAPEDWLEPAERVRIVELVDEARLVAGPVRSVLDRLAPGAQYPARLCSDRGDAIRLTERMVVAYRRSLAGWEYATAAHIPGGDVAAKFGLGHVSRPHGEDAYWLATNRIE